MGLWMQGQGLKRLRAGFSTWRAENRSRIHLHQMRYEMLARCNAGSPDSGETKFDDDQSTFLPR